MSRQGIGSGRWDRLWLVYFRMVPSAPRAFRWFHYQDSAEKLAASIRDAGGQADVKHWTMVSAD